MFLLRDFTYNGTQKPDWLLINKTHRTMFVPARASTLEVAGRRGLYYFKNKKEAKEITFDITVMGESDNDLWLKIEWLNGWLDQMKELPLEINDEPDRHYMAVFVPVGDVIEQEAAMATGSITFLIPDPYKFGLHHNYDLGDASTTKTLENAGNAPYNPLFTVDFSQDANYFGLVSPDGFIQYGTPKAVDQVAVQPLERVLFDYANDLGPWTASGVNVDYGMQTGSMLVDSGHRFKVADWGDTEATASAWHGPVLKRSLPETIQDFRATFFIELYSSGASMGRVTLNLLNAAGAIVARSIMWDRYPGGELNTGHVTAGPVSNAVDIIRSWGPKKYMWNDFLGKLVVRREGTTWKAAIMRTDASGREDYSTQIYRRISHGSDNDEIAQIQVSIMKYGNTPNPSATIRDIIIERVNQVDEEAEEVPSLFQAGDTLEIDTASGAAWLNGEYFNQYLDPGSRFFSIVPGITELKAATDNPAAVNVSVDYDERYK
jgi:predicted phage tail component-like protein